MLFSQPWYSNSKSLRYETMQCPAYRTSAFYLRILYLKDFHSSLLKSYNIHNPFALCRVQNWFNTIKKYTDAAHDCRAIKQTVDLCSRRHHDQNNIIIIILLCCGYTFSKQFESNENNFFTVLYGRGITAGIDNKPRGLIQNSTPI